MLWDEKKRELALYDIYTRKMLFYTLDGEFIRSIDDFNGESVIRDIIGTPDGGYLCYREDRSKGPTGTGNLSGLWKVDSLGNFERFIIDRTTMYPSVSGPFTFNLYPLDNEGKIGLIDQYSADIYHIDGETIDKYMAFDLPGKRLIDFPWISQMSEAGEPFYTLAYHCENGPMVLTGWIDPNMAMFVSVYSKRNGLVQVGRNARFTLDGGWVPLSFNVGTNNASVVASVILPMSILSVLEQNEIPDSTKAHFKKLTEGMSRSQIEGMNPVLMLLHLDKT